MAKLQENGLFFQVDNEAYASSLLFFGAKGGS